MAFKTSNALALVAVFFLSGCFFRLDVTSRIVFSDTNSISTDSENIRQRVIAHAKERGGECTLSKFGANCRFPDIRSSAVTEINTGIRKSGKIYVSVHSAITTLFPEDDDAVLNGEDLPQFHLEWEKWMVSAFSDYKIESRTRKVSGYDVIRDF